MNQGIDSILSVYSDARTEYTKQLCVFLVPAYFRFFIDLLEKAKQASSLEPKKTLWQFQTYLNEIHDWNMEKVNNEINIIHNNCGCDYLDDLLTAVFIAHTKVLTAIRISGNNKKVQITVPKVEHFLFRVLCESAKLLWSSAFLFRDGISGIEKQQNYRNIEQLLNEGILQAVRGLVPVKSILKDFVNNDAPDSDSDDEEDDKEMKHSEEITPEITPTPEEVLPSLSEPISTNSADTTLEENHINSENDLSESTPIPEITQSPINNKHQNNQEDNQQNNQENYIKQNEPQMIYVEDRPSVQFADFDAVLDSDNPDNSDMIFDPKDENDSPDLEILDDIGIPLSGDSDFDNMDDDLAQNVSSSDYETL